MAGSVNKVILIGNLGRDPEIRTLGSGDPVANLSLATTEHWKDKTSGERKERTEWHRVTVFGKAVGPVEMYLRKGSSVYIEGKLQTRKWTDQQGAERYTTEVVVNPFGGQIVFLGRADGEAKSQTRSGTSYDVNDRLPAQPAERPSTTITGDFDDEIPF